MRRRSSLVLELHLRNIYAEGELEPDPTIRKFRIVRLEGARQATREIEHYNLEAILAGGFRVRSPRGTQFRQWATARLQEYLLKGFVPDDERPLNPDDFSEQTPSIVIPAADRSRGQAPAGIQYSN